MNREFDETGEWTDSPRTFLIERHLADTMRTAHWHDHIEVNLLLGGDMTYLFNGRQEHVKAGIAPYKYPRAIAFVDALPKTATGKLQRFALRQMAQREV